MTEAMDRLLSRLPLPAASFRAFGTSCRILWPGQLDNRRSLIESMGNISLETGGRAIDDVPVAAMRQTLGGTHSMKGPREQDKLRRPSARHDVSLGSNRVGEPLTG